MADAFKPYLRNASGTPSGFTDSYSMTPEEYGVEFKALQYSLFSCCFAQVNIFIKVPVCVNSSDRSCKDFNV